MRIETDEEPAESPEDRVLGFRVFDGDGRALIETVIHAVRTTRSPYRVGYLNAAQYNRAASDTAFGELLRSMDLLYADGQSILWAARRAGVELPERLTAADFIGDFFRRAASAGVSIALVGGKPGSAMNFSAYWRSQVPGLEIRFERDGYFPLSDNESVREAVQASQADVVLVGMGAPRQEQFAEEASRGGTPAVWWCVGALFEYGPWGKRRAPQWMRRAGLEWAFRLAQEPRRLAGRYLIGNPLFVWRVLSRGG